MIPVGLLRELVEALKDRELVTAVKDLTAILADVRDLLRDRPLAP